MTLLSIDQEQTIFTVSALNSGVKMLLESHFTTVWVEGEISNFAAPHSGHWYFSLKDSNAQVRCAMFKGHSRKLDFVAKDGMHVLIRARVSLYENRGDYQLIAEVMEERGEGKLKRAFEALKKKLEIEGLFDAQHKKPLPLMPKCIGIVTSPTGAALRDILNVLKRRFPVASIIIYPTLVQGADAAPQIVRAIDLANNHNHCDCLIVARGGGSLEDLWPFNEEIVARAIFKSLLPVISGVGHEIDFTIADFVADQRAPTPSAAAELSVPATEQLQHILLKQLQLLKKPTLDKLTRKIQETDWLERRLLHLHPTKQVEEKRERIDAMTLTLQRLQKQILTRLKNTVNESQLKLLKNSPNNKIHALKETLQKNNDQLQTTIINILHHNKLQLAEAASKMNALSPLGTLKRGYSIALDSKKQLIKSVHAVAINDTMTVTLSDGSLECVVESKK